MSGRGAASLRWIVAAVALILIAVLSYNKVRIGGRKHLDIIGIGEVDPLTGPEGSVHGRSIHQGAELAIRRMNEAGGIKGKKLELLMADDQGSAEQAQVATRKVIGDGAIAVMGEFDTARSIAMAQVAQKERIAMVATLVTDPKVTDQGDYVYRICFEETLQAYAMAKYTTQVLKLKQVAIIRDDQDPGSAAVSNAFPFALQNMGGLVTVVENIREGQKDFKPQLAAIQKAIHDKKVQAIYFPIRAKNVDAIATAARELGIKVPFLGWNDWVDADFKIVDSKALEPAYFPAHFSPEDPSNYVQDFVRAYQAVYGELPDQYAALGYDSVRLIADAADRAPDLEVETIHRAIASTINYPAVTGAITFNEKRNPIKQMTVFSIHDAEAKFEATLFP